MHLRACACKGEADEYAELGTLRSDTAVGYVEAARLSRLGAVELEIVPNCRPETERILLGSRCLKGNQEMKERTSPQKRVGCSKDPFFIPRASVLRTVNARLQDSFYTRGMARSKKLRAEKVPPKPVGDRGGSL